MEKAYQLAAWLRRLEILPIQAPARWDVELGIVDDLLVVVDDLDLVLRQKSDRRVHIVAHGAAITLGVTRLLDLDPSAWFGLRGLDNCHYAVLSSAERSPGWRIVHWNRGEGWAAPAASAALGGFLS